MDQELEEEDRMKQTNRIKRLLSLALTAAVLLGVVLPVNGTEPELQALRFQKVDSGSVSAELRQDVAAEIQDEPEYADTDLVRVSIVLDQNPPLTRDFPQWTLPEMRQPCLIAPLCAVARPM